MSLVTTCPACATAFVVTTAQLSAHRGDVRCGKCMHIFNGLAQLTEMEGSAVSIPAPSAMPTFTETVVLADAVETPPAHEKAIEQTTHAENIPEPWPEHQSINSESVDFELDFSETPTPVLPTNVSVTDIVETPNVPSVDSNTTELTTESPASEEATLLESSTAERSPVEEPMAALPFAKPVKRSAPMWIYVLGSLLLLIAGMAQIAYFLRTEIAASYPTARPLLAQACQWLQCTVDLPHRAELFNIQDSDLQDDPEHQDVLILSSVIANHAPFAQAYPLLEVTLTDTQDKAVIRKTLVPRDYLPAGTDLKAGLAGNGEVHSQLYLAVEGTKPVGYRLFVRY